MTSDNSFRASTSYLDFERHTLANGLRVVLHRDPSLPLVAVNVWYHAGSKNEGPGKTGFAHLLEHLMFQGSEHVGTNDHFRLVQQAGGSANGSTWYDRTNYYEVLPSHQLDLGLWLESDRMGFFLPSMTQEKLDNQREVVINERRQRTDNQPYGRGFERLHELLYADGHPYRWPVIGYVEDLQNASLEAVGSFFARHYMPSNSVLTLAGSFEPDHALERIDHWFGTLPSAPPPPPVRARRPELGGEVREVLEDKVRLPRVYIAYCGPAFGERAWHAGDVLATLLADGRSSTLYHDLVYRRQLAQDVGAYIFPTEEGATFAVIATAQDGVDGDQLLAALDEHLDRAAEQVPSESELERARNRLLSDHHDQLQLLDRRADLLSLYTTYFDAPERLNEEPELYAGIGGEEVRDFAQATLRRDRRVVLTIVPAADSAAEAGR